MPIDECSFPRYSSHHLYTQYSISLGDDTNDDKEDDDDDENDDDGEDDDEDEDDGDRAPSSRMQKDWRVEISRRFFELRRYSSRGSPVAAALACCIILLLQHGSAAAALLGCRNIG